MPRPTISDAQAKAADKRRRAENRRTRAAAAAIAEGGRARDRKLDRKGRPSEARIARAEEARIAREVSDEQSSTEKRSDMGAPKLGAPKPARKQE